MFLDRRKGKIRFCRIVTLNVFVICILIWPVTSHLVSLYPLLPIGTFILFVANFILIWTSAKKATGSLMKNTRMPKLGWVGVAGATAVCVVLFASWVRNPNLQSTIQVFIGILFASYAWFLVRSLRRKQNSHLHK